MTTFSSHRIILGKVVIDSFFPSQWGYLDFFTEKYEPLFFISLLFKFLNLIGCQSDKRGSFSKKCVKYFLLRNHGLKFNTEFHKNTSEIQYIFLSSVLHLKCLQLLSEIIISVLIMNMIVSVWT